MRINVKEARTELGRKAAEFRSAVGNRAESFRQSAVVVARERVLPTLKSFVHDKDVQGVAGIVAGRAMHKLTMQYPRLETSLQSAARNPDVRLGAQVLGSVLERKARRDAIQGMNGTSGMVTFAKSAAKTLAGELGRPPKARATTA